VEEGLRLQERRASISDIEGHVVVLAVPVNPDEGILYDGFLNKFGPKRTYITQFMHCMK
jgi:hypothetical protein